MMAIECLQRLKEYERGLILLGHISYSRKEVQKAEILFKKAIEILEDDESYTLVLCLQLYGKMLQQMPERLRDS